VLSRADDGRITYALLRRSGPRLGDAEVGPAPEANAALDAVVGDLVSDRGGADATALVSFAARYVYLPSPADAALVDILDTVPGLVRASAPEGAAMWRVDGKVARVSVVGGESGPVTVPSGEVGAAGVIPPGPADRQLVLAERADPGWRATLAGEALEPVTIDGWAQGFTVPADGGEIEVTHRGSERRGWLIAQLAAVVVAIVLALPGMRRERGSVDDAADLELDEPTLPEVPGLPVAVPAPDADLVPAGAAARLPLRPRAAGAEPSGIDEPTTPYVGRRAARRRAAGGADRYPVPNGDDGAGQAAAQEQGRPVAGRSGRRAKGRRKRTGGDT
jgi:hypothetical protein